jgi:hypothetical protein
MLAQRDLPGSFDLRRYYNLSGEQYLRNPGDVFDKSHLRYCGHMFRLRHLRGFTHVQNHFHLRRIRDVQRNGHMRGRSDMPRHRHFTRIPDMRRVNDMRGHFAHVHTLNNLLDVPNVRGQLYVQDDNLRDIGNLWRVYDLQLVQHVSELADLRGPDHLHYADLPWRRDLSRRNNLRGELHVRR